MSEQIREQVSAFLDGELPGSETELLLKRLTRDPELRHSFGRYALIGEALRGGSRTPLTRDFSAKVNRAIDGEPATPAVQTLKTRQSSWWQPIAGTAVAAGVAAVAVVAWHQRAVSPGAAPTLTVAAAPSAAVVAARNVAVHSGALTAQSKEPLSYTVPAASGDAPQVVPAARFTSYVFAHSKYSAGLGQGSLLSGLLSDEQPADPKPTVAVKTAVDTTMSPPQQDPRNSP
jgi:sigma-E factor negative regulatory protein RseA